MVLDVLPLIWGHVPVLRNVIRSGTPRRSILLLSMPRSGSSWAGKILGRASDALYLREPCTDAYHRVERGQTVFEVTPETVPASYRQATRYALQGIPAFSRNVARYPRQWMPWTIHRKQVIIKEVNPLAIDWYAAHQPMAMIFLIRHPAAITKSFLKLGWWPDDSPDAWAHYGQRIADVWTHAYERLLSYEPATIVRYEDLCLNPESEYRRLYDFCEFNFSPSILEALRASTQPGDRSDIYGTMRNSQEIAYSWRDTVDDERLSALRLPLQESPVPWYADDDEW